jgi:2-methylaconitate cis-trans-isomerase PrpF
MGLIDDVSQAAERQHTPKLAWVSPPAEYTASSGRVVRGDQIDLNVRAMSMGKLHHAMMGTAAVAIASAAAIPGTLVDLAAGGGMRDRCCFGHPSGTLTVGAGATSTARGWLIERVSMSRSARVLMEGRIRVPSKV